MNNRDTIKNVLNELGIIYKMEINEINNISIDTYLINLVVDNIIISGGILDGGPPDDEHISILFYFDDDSDTNGNREKFLELVNNFNQICKYGNFFLDEDNDIVYTLSVPAIGCNNVDRDVFKYYFDSFMSITKDVVKDYISYGQ